MLESDLSSFGSRQEIADELLLANGLTSEHCRYPQKSGKFFFGVSFSPSFVECDNHHNERRVCSFPGWTFVPLWSDRLPRRVKTLRSSRDVHGGHDTNNLSRHCPRPDVQGSEPFPGYVGQEELNLAGV